VDEPEVRVLGPKIWKLDGDLLDKTGRGSSFIGHDDADLEKTHTENTECSMSGSPI
jgi:hypothetical protein